MLHDVVTGRTIVPDGQVVGMLAGGRALIRRIGPQASLLDLDGATGQAHEILSGSDWDVGIAADGAAVILTGRKENTWLYFAESRELRFVTPHVSRRPELPLRSAGRFMLWNPDGALLVDVERRLVTALGRLNGATVTSDRTAIYLDAASQAWAWAPDRVPLPLGRYGDWYRLSSRIDAAHRVAAPSGQSALLVDADGNARLFHLQTVTTSALATDVESAEMGPDGTHAVLVRRADGVRSVVVLELSSRRERLVYRTPHPVTYPRLAPGAGHVAFVETIRPHEDEDAYHHARLFAVDTSREIPLEGLHPSWPDRWGLDFHAGGSVLRSWVWDGTERLHDTSTGRVRYMTGRSVVGNEGRYSFWGPTDRRFYTPVGGYSGFPTDIYLWDAADGTERRLATRGDLLCTGERRDVLYEHVEGGWNIESAPADLVGWTHDSREKWLISERPGWVPHCTEDRILFFEHGRFVEADLVNRTRRTVVEKIHSSLLEEDRLIYSDDVSICVLPFRTP